MENHTEINREELEKLLEKAKRDAQEMLDKMTPEERAQAQARADKAIAEDQAAMQKLIDDAAALMSGSATHQKKAAVFCKHCGAPSEGGKFCAYCGMAL